MGPRVLLRMAAGEIDGTLASSRFEGAAAVPYVGGEIIIRRAVEEVFDFVADGRNEPRSQPQDGSPGHAPSAPIGAQPYPTAVSLQARRLA
jgi:hypothetical protein